MYECPGYVVNMGWAWHGQGHSAGVWRHAWVASHDERRTRTQIADTESCHCVCMSGCRKGDTYISLDERSIAIGLGKLGRSGLRNMPSTPHAFCKLVASIHQSSGTSSKVTLSNAQYCCACLFTGTGIQRGAFCRATCSGAWGIWEGGNNNMAVTTGLHKINCLIYAPR